MFRCGVCKFVSVSGESAARIVLERRAKVYDLGGATTEGWEVVREILAHAGCVPGMTDLMIEPEAIEEYLEEEESEKPRRRK